jgi:hypothetical protein
MNKILKTTHEGQLKILDKILPCAVLEDGTRIISSSAIYLAFDRTPRGSARGGVKTHLRKLPSFMDANNLKPYIEQGMQDLAHHIIYIDKNKTNKKGYKAEILTALCDVYLQARKDNKLTYQQKKLAEISEIMLRSLAKVGITALVDEATGYQNVRAKDALQIILDKYLLKEFATWSKKFPDEFYIQMFRLKKWDINNVSFSKRPGVVGKYTNDIVYERLAPEILKELRKRNPKNSSGNRKSKHHQFLTEDIGHPALSQHLHTVIHFMKAAANWEDFRRMIQRALPKKGEQMLLDM